MAIEITIPRLGWSSDESTFVQWLKNEGDFVDAGEPMFALESDKALQEIESVDAGYLKKIANGPQEGDTVAVGTLVAYLVERDEALPSSTAPVADPTPATTPAPITTPDAIEQPKTIDTPVSNIADIHNPTISPRAAKLAGQHDVDWKNIVGSGSTGRIRERDVKALIDEQRAQFPGPGHQPLSNLRKTIAQRMLSSAQTTAPVTLTTRVDATNLVLLRNRLRELASPCTPTYQDMIIYVAAQSLEMHPAVNSQWTDEGLFQPAGIHIGIAVDTEAGLLVPVVQHVNRLSLSELAAHSKPLIDRAKRRACSLEELNGGTFSVTNLGAFGVDAFTPVINSPQTAILGIGRIRRELVVLENDQFAARDQLTLSLTFDHRVVDGAPAAKFLQQISRGIESLKVE